MIVINRNCLFNVITLKNHKDLWEKCEDILGKKTRNIINQPHKQTKKLNHHRKYSHNPLFLNWHEATKIQTHFQHKKREIFTSFKPSTTAPILQFFSSIWDLGFNKFWRMMERGRFWGSIYAEQWRERVDIV
jgi:hypothetical protein